ncbi:MAG: glycosyltransferase, partial [Enterococcus sp.]
MKYDFEMDIDESTSVGKIAAHIKEGTSILEFGPGNGRMTKHLMGKKKCEVSIVELDKELYDYVSQIATDSFYGNIEEYTWAEHFSGKKFDYILFADVLEHLLDPKKTLEVVKEFLKDDGEILITFPNIAHNSVLINLFNNKLEWTKYGLLDATHKTFFTQAGFEKVFDEVGLFIQREDFTFNEVGNNELSAHYEDLPLELHYAFRMRPYGEVYQYFFALKKHPVENPEIAVLENHNFIKSMKIIYQFSDHREEKVQKINSYTNENSVFSLTVPTGVEEVLFYPFPENLGGVISFYVESNDQELETVTSSAVFSDDNKYLFTNMTPAYLTVSGNEVAGKELLINLAYDFQGQYYLELNKLMLAYQAANTEKENLVRRYNQVLTNQTDFTKTPLKKFVHEVSFSIDEVKYNPKTDTTTIRGWAFDNQQHQPLVFDVAADNSPIVHSRVIDRPDVAEHFDLENEQLGFEIDIYDPNRRKSFDLILISASNFTYGVVIDTENASYLPIKKQSKARKFASSIKHRGIMGTANHILKRTQQQNDYEKWILKNEIFDQTAIEQEIADFAFQPKLSIVVPVYNVEEKWLDACISSLKNQFYGNWELCLADDASPKEYIKPLLKKYAAEDDRIKLVFREKNGHISEATNSALEIATGEYIGF